MTVAKADQLGFYQSVLSYFYRKRRMDSVDGFLDNLKKAQERRQQELLEKEKLRKEEVERFAQTLSQLNEEKKQCVATINKNLSSITSSKHSIHKSIQEPNDDNELPISNASKKHALNFFNDAMVFINWQGETSEKIGEEDIDPGKLSIAIQNSNENSKKEVVRVNHKLAAVQTVIDSISGLPGYMDPVNNQDEEQQLDTSLI